tara:strand:- start:1754 stop:2161 length:408 start_codon:yes stop_codon:yes gene_type:complete
VKERESTSIEREEAEVYELNLTSLFEDALDRRLGQDPIIQNRTKSAQVYSTKEREELEALVAKILEDGVFDSEERMELGHLEHIETMIGELMGLVNLENPELGREFDSAVEVFRQRLLGIASKGKNIKGASHEEI